MSKWAAIDKRRRLGLDMNGKIKPFVYAANQFSLFGILPPDVRLYKPTRKQSMIAALQAERIMRTYPHWIEQGEDREQLRQRVMKNWIRWQMRVKFKRLSAKMLKNTG